MFPGGGFDSTGARTVGLFMVVDMTLRGAPTVSSQIQKYPWA